MSFATVTLLMPLVAGGAIVLAGVHGEPRCSAAAAWLDRAGSKFALMRGTTGMSDAARS
jgi:hypothetical protein